MAFTVDGCCSMSLRTAGFFIGWMGAGLSVVAFILRIIFVFGDQYSETEIPVYLTFLILMVYLALKLLVCGLLIRGIMMNKHLYLLPTLILGGIGLLLISLMSFMLLSVGFFSITKRPDLIGMGVLLLIPISLGWWTWIVVYSLYEKIRLSTRNTLTVQLQAENGQMQTPPNSQLITK